jgi:hypothetical protein
MRTSSLRLTALALGPLLTVTVVACGGAAHSGGSSAGSCAGGSPSARFAAAQIVFTGTILSGPTISTGQGNVLLSPARVRVVHYVKGSGPAVVTVITADTRGGTVTNAEGIRPQAGQNWKIYTTSRSMPYQTSVCAGSMSLQ